MENKNLGMSVRVVFSERAKQIGIHDTTYHNITEIHYNYPRFIEKSKSIAFESDIHGTGITWAIADIQEFETSLETERAASF